MGETIASIGLVTSLPRFYACKFPQSDATTRASPPKRGTRKRGGRPCCDFSSRGATTSATTAHLEPTFSQPVDRPAANRATQQRKIRAPRLSTLARCGSKLWSHTGARSQRRKSNEEAGKGERTSDSIFRSKTMVRGRRKQLVFFRYLLRFWVSRFLLFLSLSLFRPSYEDVDVTCASVNTHRWIGLITGIGYKSSSGHPRDRNYF